MTAVDIWPLRPRRLGSRRKRSCLCEQPHGSSRTLDTISGGSREDGPMQTGVQRGHSADVVSPK